MISDEEAPVSILRDKIIREKWPSLLAQACVLHAWRVHLFRLCRASTSAGGGAITAALHHQHIPKYDPDPVEALVRRLEVELRQLELGSAEFAELAPILVEELAKVTRGDPFRRMFDHVVEHVKTLYPDWIPTDFSCTSQPFHPRDKNENVYCVNAHCDFDDVDILQPGEPNPGDQLSRVKLIFWTPQVTLRHVDEIRHGAARLGPHAYASIPMLLVHECVSHAQAAQREADNSDLFSEGLMDWASWFFFTQWIGRIDPDLAAAARQHGHELRDWSMRHGKFADLRMTANGIAEDLVAWMEGPPLRTSYDEARAHLARIAVEMNRHRPGPERDEAFAKGYKHNFVAALTRPLGGALETELVAWVRHERRDLDRLIRAATEDI